MTDLYLAFTDEAAANAVLFTQEPTEWDEEGNATAFEPRQSYRNIDTIGVIYKPTGETTEQDGMAVPVMAAIPGWHVNVRLVDGEDAEPLRAFEVHPTVPRRVWA
jgi:hypothetical protein